MLNFGSVCEHCARAISGKIFIHECLNSAGRRLNSAWRTLNSAWRTLNSAEHRDVTQRSPFDRRRLVNHGQQHPLSDSNEGVFHCPLLLLMNWLPSTPEHRLGLTDIHQIQVLPSNFKSTTHTTPSIQQFFVSTLSRAACRCRLPLPQFCQ